MLRRRSLNWKHGCLSLASNDTISQIILVAAEQLRIFSLHITGDKLMNSVMHSKT